MGFVSWGSIPLTCVGFVAVLFALLFLRILSHCSAPSVGHNGAKEVAMEKTIDRIRLSFSFLFETMWAIGVGGVAWSLST